MKTIIAGSRTITDIKHVLDAAAVCGWLISEVVSGTARGVDLLGEQAAAMAGVPVKRFPADWDKYGKKAGYLRNMQMAEYAEALLAIWDGISAGTNHMINIAKTKGLRTYVHTVDLLAKVINSFDGEYRFLSNFYPCEVRFEGYWYRSTEAAYQAAKTLDLHLRTQFVDLDAGKAKRLGKTLQLRPDWETIKVDVMWALIQQKFAPGTALAAQLLATGSAQLIEGNHWGDTFWGMCNGVGENWLGKLLMKQREYLRSCTVVINK